MLCKTEEKSCRSVNFKKISNCDKNCELLEDVASEKPKYLLEDEQFDHYLLLDANRVSDARTLVFHSYPKDRLELMCYVIQGV